MLIRRPCKKEEFKKKINDHRKKGKHITKLLQTFKSWGGPCTTANELEIVFLNKNKDVSKLSELNCKNS